MAQRRVILSSKRPDPPKADFAFYIDFKRGTGSPSRVFTATRDFILACERLDRELVKSVDPAIRPVLTLEDIEAGSLRTWFRSALISTDDQALRHLDWKPIVGEYLVRAKYAALRWTEDGAPNKRLTDLSGEIRRIAAETDVRHLPDYAPPSPVALLTAAKDFQAVKDVLSREDRAEYQSTAGDVEFNMSVRWDVEDIEALAVKQTLQFPPAPMILAVKKPDYLGDSQWEFRHGKKALRAKIADPEWLGRFQGREIDVRPGDALRCIVEIENLYGHDNELIAEHVVVTKVEGVVPNQYRQDILFEED